MKARRFTVENWTLRVDSLPHPVITFTPNYRTFFSKLVFTLMLFLCAAGVVGIDYELRRLRRNHLVTPEEAAFHKQGYDDQIAVERRARGDAAAEKLRGELYAFVDSHAAKKAAYVAELESQQAPWHLATRGSIALLAGWGVFIPLSLLWRRLWITRADNDLLFTYRTMLLFPRTARIAAEAARTPRVTVQEIRVRVRYGTVSDGFRWQLTFTDAAGRSLILFPRRSKKPSPGTLDPAVSALVTALQSL